MIFNHEISPTGRFGSLAMEIFDTQIFTRIANEFRLRRSNYPFESILSNPWPVGRTWLVVAIFLLIAPMGLASDSLEFYVDIARFHAVEGMMTVEIDYEIPYYSLSYKKEEGKAGDASLLRADVQSILILKDRNSGEEQRNEKTLTIYISSLKDAETKGKAALDRRKWECPTGTYDLTFQLKDLNFNKSGIPS